MLILNEPDGLTLSQAYLVKTIKTRVDWLDRRALPAAALAEIANIVVHAAPNVWADACGIGLLLSVPTLWRGSAQELEPQLRERLRQAGGFSLALTMELSCERLPARCSVKVLMTDPFVEKLLTAHPV